MILLTSLPLNLLAIIVSGTIVYQAAGKLRDSYTMELDTVVTQLKGVMSDLEESFLIFQRAYSTELGLSLNQNEMLPYELLTELAEAFERGNADGCFYLFDTQNERLYLRCTKGSYTAEEIEKIKERISLLLTDQEETGAENSWSQLSVTNLFFLLMKRDFTNYKTGFLLDLGGFLHEKDFSVFRTENDLYIGIEEQLFRFDNKSGRVVSYRDLTWDSLFKKSLFDQNLTEELETVPLQFGIRIRNSALTGGLTRYYFLLLLSVCSVFLTVFLWHTIKKRVIKALTILSEGMLELSQDHLDYRIENWETKESSEFVFLYENFNKMAGEIRASREKDVKMLQAQLDNLRLQVNPHMLLNSFNMIYSLAQSKNYSCIQEYSLLLVDYFRYSLKSTDHFVPLKNEMEFVKNYIAIQRIRFPGAFTSVHSIGEDCTEALVPPLLIENFVENAMKYALISGETIEVLINIRKDGNRLLISVCDTGRGIKPEILECLQKGEIYKDKHGKEHIGIWNCRRRMELFYGEDAAMNIISTPGEGTQIWLDIPFMTIEGREQ